MRKHHNKLFYGKYTHKNVFDMPWAGILYPTSDENLQKMLDGTHIDTLHLNKMFHKVDDKVLRLAKFIMDYRKQMKFRIQQYSVIFYSNKDFAAKIVNTFWNHWNGSECLNPNAKKIDKHTIFCKRLPHGKYQYQVHLKKNVHTILKKSEIHTLWSFLTRNKNHCLVTNRYVKDYLMGFTPHCFHGYFYIDKAKMLTPIYMMAQKAIDKVIKFEKEKNGSN